MKDIWAYVDASPMLSGHFQTLHVLFEWILENFDSDEKKVFPNFRRFLEYSDISKDKAEKNIFIRISR